MESHPIELTEEKETLFVPLYSKAMESRREHPILADPTAEAILARVGYDFAALRTPHKSQVTLAMRAKKLDACVAAFLARNPGAAVLHLGCGLDSRFVRVGSPAVPWYDVDYPEVIALRREFYPETETYHLLGSSVTDLSWMDQVHYAGPAIIIAEGLLMYLTGAQVEALVLALRRRFPDSEIAFDAFSTLTARNIKRHPAMIKTGAQICWGLDDPHAVEGWAAGIRLLEEWPFTASEDIPHLSPGDRFMFRVMGALRVARQAHRILRYQL